jgi:hypothetical protein
LSWYWDKVRDRQIVSVFYMWISNFPSNICWRACLLCALGSFVEDQLAVASWVYVWVFYSNLLVFMSIFVTHILIAMIVKIFHRLAFASIYFESFLLHPHFWCQVHRRHSNHDILWSCTFGYDALVRWHSGQCKCHWRPSLHENSYWQIDVAANAQKHMTMWTDCWVPFQDL